MNKEIKFNNAITKAGYLKKQSPGMLKLYRSRYYSFRDKGRALIWFKKQPSNIEERPKGVIMVADIKEVKPDEKDPLVFYIHYPERQFRLKASSTEDRQEWLDSLTTVRQYLKQQTEPLTQDKTLSPTKKEGWKWENATSELAKKIQVENEEIFINDSEINDVEFSPEKGREMLKMKNIVQNTHNEDLMDRIVMGFLYKKGKLNKITQWRLRWFFMVSQYNLRNAEDCRFLQFSQLPTWVETNTMYYFSPSDDTDFKGSVKVKQVKEIVMEVNQTPYKMIVKVEQGQGERQYHLGSRYMIEIKKWQVAIYTIQERFTREAAQQQSKLKALQIQPVAYEQQAIYDQKPVYFVIKSTVAVIFQSKENQNINQSKLVRYDGILKYTTDKTKLTIIVAPSPVTIQFKDEEICSEAYKKLKEAIEQMTKKAEQIEENTENSKPQKQIVYDRGDVSEENGYLSKRLNKRMTRSKNYFNMISMEITTAEPPPKQQEGFWGRISKMFCGGREQQP